MMIVSMNHSPRVESGGLVDRVGEPGAVARGRCGWRRPIREHHPVIEERMLSDRGDLARLRDATRRMLEMVASPPFAEIAAHVAIDLRGTPASELDGDEAIDRWLLATSSDAQHICATAAMGRVVDAECRVLGVDGLRVIDASVFPEVPRANTHLMVLALAEAMSDRLGGVRGG